MKKYLFLMCFTLFLFSCNHDNGNGKTDGQTLLPPSGVKAVATENVGELKITWDQVANNSGYEVHYKNTKSNENKTKAIAKDAVLDMLTGLEGGTEYEVSLKTKGDGKSFLDSPTSIVVKATPKNGGGGGSQKLATPASFKAKITGKSGEVELSWQAVQHASGYEVSYKKTISTDNKKTQNVESNKLSCLVSSLENNTEYSFFIVAKGDGSTWLNSDESAEVKATPSNKIASPTNLTVFLLNEKGALFVTWQEVKNNNGYTIKYLAEGEEEKTQEVEKDNDYSTLKGLAEGKEYSISIMTKAASGFSPSDYSEIVKCKTLDGSDVLVLEKIEIEGQEDIIGDSFTDSIVNDDGSLRLANPNKLHFNITTDEKTITPRFTGSSLKSYEIYRVDGADVQKLEHNKIKFEKDKIYAFQIVAKTNKDLVVNYEFEGKALDVSFDVQALYLKGDQSNNAVTVDEIREIIDEPKYLIKPELRNTKDLKVNIKKDATLGENQKFLFILFLGNDDEMNKVEFDNTNAENTDVDGKKCYYKILTPDSTGKAVINAKFTLKSGTVEDRKYEFTKSDANTNTDIKAILFGNDEIAPVAIPSTYLTLFVPESYRGKAYPITAKFDNNATYSLSFWDEVLNDWKKVEQGSNLNITGNEDKFLINVSPEIGQGLYEWLGVEVKIVVGAKDTPNFNSLKDILMGSTSIKTGTTKENAVAVTATDLEEVTIQFDDDSEFNEAFVYSIEEWNKFEALSQKEKLDVELNMPQKEDLKAEGSEFVILLTREIAEGYKDAIYHVWLKKKE